MRIELNFVVPLDHFYSEFDEWKISLLQQYGIGVEDVFLEAFSINICHIVSVERVWFEQYLDVSQVVNMWIKMQGSKACTATQPGLISVFIDAVYTVYDTYFQFFKATYQHYGIEPSEDNVNGNLRIANLHWLDRSNVNLRMLFDTPESQINRV